MKFDKKNKLSFDLSEPSFKAEALQFPLKEEIISWEEIFRLCNEYRTKKDLGNEEYVFLLTDIANYNNWFSSARNIPKRYCHYSECQSALAQ